MSIIKRRKTSQYLQLHNHPVQKDLDDLEAIGLLTYIMSLPEDWTLYKTYLQTKFSRRKVDRAWKILVEKKYIVGFIAYVDRKKKYFYNVSDIPFTEKEFFQFVDETLKEESKKSDYIGSIKEIPNNAFKIPENLDESSTVQNVQQSIVQNVQYSTDHFEQYNKYSSNCKVQNVHIQNNNKQNKDKQKNIKKENIVNLQDRPINKFLNQEDFKISLTEACNSFYSEFAPGRWDKKSWFVLVNKFVEETINNNRNETIPEDKILSYAYQSIKGIAYKHDLKFGKKSFATMIENNGSSFYDWLSQKDIDE